MSVVSNESPLVEIRPFEIEFLEPCISIYMDVFSQPHWNESWTPQLVRKRLKRIIERKGFSGFITLVESQPVGYILGNHLNIYPLKNYFHIQELLVARQYQGFGIGKQLMESLIERLKEINIRYMSLFTRKGSTADNIYQKMGFKKMLWGFSLKKLVWMTYSFSTINSR